MKKTIFKELYPFPLPEEKLDKTDLFPILVDIKDADETLSLIFCSRRSIIERTEINPENFEFTIESKNKLDDYDKIYGIKKRIYQLFDAIVIWKKKNIIEVRIDISKELSSQERNISFTKVINQFNNLVTQKLHLRVLVKEYINFFPLIHSLYSKSGEGKVTHLSFVTDEGSIKYEKMRKMTKDLRHETYHKAGKNAVDHITPYYLAISWIFQISNEIKSDITLILPGKLYIINSPYPSLEEVIIKGCFVLEQYNFIFDKINEYLSNEN